MKKDHTSNPWRRATSGPFRQRSRSPTRNLDRREGQTGENFQDWSFPTLGIVNETKLVVLAAMQEKGRPVFTSELYQALGQSICQLVVDYHLVTLVKIGLSNWFLAIRNCVSSPRVNRTYFIRPEHHNFRARVAARLNRRESHAGSKVDRGRDCCFAHDELRCCGRGRGCRRRRSIGRPCRAYQSACLG